jgi:hypothetical protein
MMGDAVLLDSKNKYELDKTTGSRKCVIVSGLLSGPV